MNSGHRPPTVDTLFSVPGPILRIRTPVVGREEIIVPLDRPSITLGRDAGNDVVLLEQAASRRHARVEYRPQGWTVIDEDSANGITVGGQAVREHVLHDGQSFRIGGTEVTLVLDPGAQATVYRADDAPGRPVPAAPAAPAAPRPETARSWVLEGSDRGPEASPSPSPSASWAMEGGSPDGGYGARPSSLVARPRIWLRVMLALLLLALAAIAIASFALGVPPRDLGPALFGDGAAPTTG